MDKWQRIEVTLPSGASFTADIISDGGAKTFGLKDASTGEEYHVVVIPPPEDRDNG